MQIELVDVVRLIGGGIGVGIILSFIPWVAGSLIGFAINLMKK